MHTGIIIIVVVIVVYLPASLDESLDLPIYLVPCDHPRPFSGQRIFILHPSSSVAEWS